MTRTRLSIRLLAEILLIVGLAQGAATFILPTLGAGFSAAGQALLGVLLALLLAAPTLYWRCLSLPQSERPANRNAVPHTRGTSVGFAVAMTAGAQALGLALTAASAVALSRDIDATARERFDRGVERIEAEVTRHFNMPLYGLNGLRGMYAARGDVSRDEFRAWVDTRNLTIEFPGVRGFGFVERIPAERPGGGPDRYLIKYSEPGPTNAAAIGRDAVRDAPRREANERAVQTGLPTLSAPITLTKDGKPTVGFVYLLAVYRGGEGFGAREREARLGGVLFAPIIARDILHGVTDVADGTLDLQLFDGDLEWTGGGHLVFDGVSPQATVPAHPLQTVRIFDVGGRTLSLRISSNPAFEASIDRSGVALVAVGGSFGSVLLALTVWLLAIGRARAQRRAERMTADLARLAAVVRHTSSSVAISDTQQRITWVNDGFTRITGYTLEDAAGKTPAELLGSGRSDPAALAALQDATASERACRVELLNRARDGREYWIDTEVQPVRDAQGVLTGFMEVGSDVTAQKRTRLQLEAAIRDTDALLRTVHQHAIVSVADRRGRIVEVNDAFCRISGFSRDELMGQDHRIVNSGVQPSAFWSQMWGTIAGGAPWRGDICNRARDGSLYWVDSMIAPFVGADGSIEKYVSIRTDISASKLARQRLAEMADRLTLAIEGGSDGLCDWLDVSADAQWWSPSFYALLGLPADAADASQSRFVSLLHPDHLAAHARATADALAGGKPLDMELLLRTATAGYRWFRSRAKVYADAGARVVRMAGSLQDIHDRKQAERDLGRERKRLDDILEGTNCGTWEWNIETGKTRFNERWAQMAGHTLEALGDTTIETWADSVHPDDRPRNAELLQQHFDGESAHFETESRVQHVAGHWIWVLDRGKLFARSVDGRPRWMAGTRIDITERKQAELSLHDSEAFLDRAGRIAGVGGWRLDLASSLVTWTDQTCRIHDLAPGYRPTLVEALMYYTPEARPQMQAAVADCIAHGGSWDLELPLVTAAGRHIWVRAIGEAEFEDGKAVRLIGAFQDVTERRALDAELRRGHELMAGVLQNLPCGLSVFDHELRLVTHNAQFQQLLDLPEQLFQTPGIRFDQFVRFSAERGEYGGKSVEATVERVLASVRRPVVQFFERLPPHGVPLEVRRAPIPGGGFVTTYTDISTRKRAEILLTETLARAEQASVTKSQFLANMSHEIRTPMNAILGMLGLLQKTQLTARQADYATKTAGAARSLLGLLNDILDFSKADAGKMTLDPRPFRVDQLLRDLSVVLSANVGAKTIDVLYDIDPLLPAVLLGDDMRLQQVLINLGGNAIKFTSEGQVVLSLRVLERTPDDVCLRIAMQDSGIGIAPENQAHIFTGFSQAEASTTRRFGGTGLGLAICQRLVRLMGSELQVDSTPGAGSTFHFELRLPLAELPDDALGAERPPLGPLRTLIVDDNASARDVFAEMAAALGWQVDVAPGGAAALALAADRIAQGRPHEAVFIDWKMAGMDGWETGRRLLEVARTGGHPDPLLVMITGHGRETLAERSDGEQAMLSGFLVKPVTASMLGQAISDARFASARPGRPIPAPGAESARPLAGLRLLLVEDNPNNQQVAQELLTSEGATVTLADNGQLGVAAVAAADPPFDAVLMDVQMPVMDGYTATAQIRQRLGLRSLPIIAMTANVMASDREACLAAGMNEHVGKPFDLAQLVAVLLRHTGRGTPARSVAPPAAEALPPALLDDARQRGIELATALGRMGGNRPAYLRALTSFADDVATLPERLAAVVAGGRADEAGRLMHTLRGLAATLGIQPLAQVAADAERRFNTESTPTDPAALLDRLGALVASTLRDVAHVGAALRATLQESPVAPDAPPPDLAQLRRSLDELATLLRTADMRALEVFDHLQQGQGPAWADRLRPLDAALASLDFDQALVHCLSLNARLAA